MTASRAVPARTRSLVQLFLGFRLFPGLTLVIRFLNSNFLAPLEPLEPLLADFEERLREPELDSDFLAPLEPLEPLPPDFEEPLLDPEADAPLRDPELDRDLFRL